MRQYACLASLLPLVAAHGFLSSPPARRPGSAYRATCGEQPFYQQSSDINGNVQGIQQVVGNDKTEDCNLWLCKGFLLEDNLDKVQSYSLGQTIDIVVNIAAPHTGYANVSVVRTSTNTIIGNPLIEFENYASNAGMAANNTAFSVTLPDTLDGDCTAAGDCVLQWFWDAPDIDQTYLACADFTVAGGSASSSTAPASSASASSASATSAAVITTAPPAVTASTSIDTAPTTTSTAAPDNTDECTAEDDDEDDDQGEGDDGDDDECPTDDGQDDDGDDDEDDDDGTEEECPVDDDATATSTLAANDASTSAAATTTAGSHTSIITQVITSTVTTERVVTVTAPATACN